MPGRDSRKWAIGSTGAVVSEALRRYLAERRPSACEPGQHLFGRYGSRTGDGSVRRKELYRGKTEVAGEAKRERALYRFGEGDFREAGACDGECKLG